MIVLLLSCIILSCYSREEHEEDVYSCKHVNGRKFDLDEDDYKLHVKLKSNNDDRNDDEYMDELMEDDYGVNELNNSSSSEIINSDSNSNTVISSESDSSSSNSHPGDPFDLTLPIRELWHNFQIIFNKTYSSKEEKQRRFQQFSVC